MRGFPNLYKKADHKEERISKRFSNQKAELRDT